MRKKTAYAEKQLTQKNSLRRKTAYAEMRKHSLRRNEKAQLSQK